MELPETWVEGPGHASVQYNQLVHTGNIPSILPMARMNLEYGAVMDHSSEFWSREEVGSDFGVVVEVYQSDGN